MELVINSRKHGKVVFFANTTADRDVYLWVSFDDSPLAQICEGGGLRGLTLLAKEETFEKKCRSWWRAFLKNER